MSDPDDSPDMIHAAEQAWAENDRLRDRIAELEAAFREILRCGERHVPEATGRRIADFADALEIARNALGESGD